MDWHADKNHQHRIRRTLQVGRPTRNRLRRLAPRQGTGTQRYRRDHASSYQRSPSLSHACAPVFLRPRRRTNPGSRTPRLRPSSWRRSRNLSRPTPSGNQSKRRARAYPRHQSTPKPRRQNHGIATGNKTRWPIVFHPSTRPGVPSFAASSQTGVPPALLVGWTEWVIRVANRLTHTRYND
jgi:hypothetical protein